MTLSKFFWFALFVGIQGAIAQIIDNLIVGSGVFPVGMIGFSWIAFLAWATYFLMGCNIKGGIKALLCFGVGIIVGITIISLGKQFYFLKQLSFPISIIIVVTGCMFLEKVPPVDSIAAIFIGCGIFFGFINYVPNANYINASLIILGYGIFGIICGWTTIMFRTWYEKNNILGKEEEK